MAMPQIRVLVVDDYEPWHRFVSTVLGKDPNLKVIGQVFDGLEAVQQAEKLQPDLILLDIGLPMLNGIEVARRIKKISPISKILFATENRSSDIVEDALSTGADGYLVKSDAAKELLPAVMAVLKGTQFVGPSLCTQTPLGNNAYLRFAHSPSMSDFLASVINASAADYGTFQFFDSRRGELRIVAQHGFRTEFLDYFTTVHCDHDCVCSAAMNCSSRVVVTDVATDPLLSSESRGVLLRAKVRAVQSTPLVETPGKLIGMVSTHYSHPGGPTPNALQNVDALVATFLAKLDSLSS
jgi:DNA-binding NarL/FixJ family response regulator